MSCSNNSPSRSTGDARCELFLQPEGHAIWLFPGLGCRFVGMGADVLGRYPAARRLVDQANEFLGWDVISACLEGSGRKLVPLRQESQLIYTVCCVYAAVLRDRGYHPSLVCGHSLGTWAAVHAAGVYDFLTGLQLVSDVEDVMASRLDGCDQGMGLVVGLSQETLARLCVTEPDVSLANINCPGQYVLGGTRAGVTRVLAAAQVSGASKTMLLPVARALHTSLLDDLNAEVGGMLAVLPLRPPLVPVVSVWDGARLTCIDELRQYLSRLLSRPVRWEMTIRQLLTVPKAKFIEVGPAAILSGMMPYLDRTVRAHTASEVLNSSKDEDLVAEGEA